MRYFHRGAAMAAVSTVAILMASSSSVSHAGPQQVSQSFSERCVALGAGGADGVVRAAAVAEGPIGAGASPFLPRDLRLPAHCEISGVLDARKGVGGQSYAIRYHLRLPEKWNGKFFFQGGGGLDGQVGDAIGMVGFGVAPALTQGYAVVTQDSGHDSGLNSDPALGGEAAFGADPQARANYGGASLKRVSDAAKDAIRRFYGKSPEHSYFVGCSKGGQEGMAVAQRYPDAFDGVVAAAPGFSLPRAALAEVWDVQTYASLVGPNEAGKMPFAKLSNAFSASDFSLVRDSILRACDADDGLVDGIVGRFGQCTSAKVLPALRQVTCKAGKAEGCLSTAQVTALARSMAGPRDGRGRPLYATWAWDGGIGSGPWRGWKLGNDQMPALNVVLAGPALAMVFSVPPTPLGMDPQKILDWQLAFDFAKDGGRIYATNATFPRSAWQDASARSPDLAAFRAHGGRMIVPHGASDPVFSINDTLAWYREVQARQGKGARAADFVRVFPVPGMAHCAGGPATDSFDAFSALTAWVEKGQAPERIIAKAGPSSPWPGRTRPLCAYPKVATYSGKGSIENAGSFVCR